MNSQASRPPSGLGIRSSCSLEVDGPLSRSRELGSCLGGTSSTWISFHGSVIEELVEEDWDMSVVKATGINGASLRRDGGVEAMSSDVSVQVKRVGTKR